MFPPRKDAMLRLGIGWGGKLSPPPYTRTFLPKLILKVQRCPLSNTCSCCFGRAVRLALPLLCSVFSAKRQYFMRNANEKKPDVTVLNSSLTPQLNLGRNFWGRGKALLYPGSFPPARCLLLTGLREVLKEKAQESFFYIAVCEIIDHSWLF